MQDLPTSPACGRNQGPILAALRSLLNPQGRALEIASGTGQHVAHFARELPGWQWQPTDRGDELFFAIQARCAGLPNALPPRRLDVLQTPWPADGGPPFAPGTFDLVLCAHRMHIAPWACAAALMQGAAHCLAPGGQLVTYGPYLEDGAPTAPSNQAFDTDLRARNPAWGIRRLDDVAAEAEAAGLALHGRHALPANNLVLVFWGRAVAKKES